MADLTVFVLVRSIHIQQKQSETWKSQTAPSAESEWN